MNSEHFRKAMEANKRLKPTKDSELPEDSEPVTEISDFIESVKDLEPAIEIVEPVVNFEPAIEQKSKRGRPATGKRSKVDWVGR